MAAGSHGVGSQMSRDDGRVEQFVAQVISDVAAVPRMALVRVGHRLGLYRALWGAGPLTAAELAKRTGTDVRRVRDWLDNQVAGGYLRAAGRNAYELPDEHAAVLADASSPWFIASSLDGLAAIWAASDVVEIAYRVPGAVPDRGLGPEEDDLQLIDHAEETPLPSP